MFWLKHIHAFNLGDRVSGDILTLEDTVLKVDTDYADVLNIDWEDVEGLTSDKPLWVSFHEDAVIPEGIGVRDGERLIRFSFGSTRVARFNWTKSRRLICLNCPTGGTLDLGGVRLQGTHPPKPSMPRER